MKHIEAGRLFALIAAVLAGTAVRGLRAAEPTVTATAIQGRRALNTGRRDWQKSAMPPGSAQRPHWKHRARGADADPQPAAGSKSFDRIGTC